MRAFILFVLFIDACCCLRAQVEYDYSHALKHFESQIGTWKADNAKYRNENERITAYVIEWRFNELRNNIYGKLYGLIDSNKVGPYWEFLQYWNPNMSKIEFIQIGNEGTMGFGPLTVLNGGEYELIQLFTSIKNEKRYEKHSYIRPNANTEITVAFEKHIDGTWIKKRTYTWIKL